MLGVVVGGLWWARGCSPSGTVGRLLTLSVFVIAGAVSVLIVTKGRLTDAFWHDSRDYARMLEATAGVRMTSRSVIVGAYALVAIVAGWGVFKRVKWAAPILVIVVIVAVVLSRFVVRGMPGAF